MNRNFQRALSLVLKSEGGWSDNPADPGGATMRGVTLATFRRYIDPKGTKDDLRHITDARLGRSIESSTGTPSLATICPMASTMPSWTSQ